MSDQKKLTAEEIKKLRDSKQKKVHEGDIITKGKQDEVKR